MENLQNEIWKDVIVDKEKTGKYTGLYQISNKGRVKSFHGSCRILKHGIDKNGYEQVVLSLNGKRKQYKVHRLVLLAFDYANYFEGAEVNHKNENPSDNCLSNLEWCTGKYNCNYGNHCINISTSNKGRKLTTEQCEAIRMRKIGLYVGKLNPAYGTHTNGKEIICLNNLAVYSSARQAGKELNCDNSTITKVCKGKNKTTQGYRFMYYNDYLRQENTEITIDIKIPIVS